MRSVFAISTLLLAGGCRPIIEEGTASVARTLDGGVPQVMFTNAIFGPSASLPQLITPLANITGATAVVVLSGDSAVCDTISKAETPPSQLVIYLFNVDDNQKATPATGPGTFVAPFPGINATFVGASAFIEGQAAPTSWCSFTSGAVTWLQGTVTVTALSAMSLSGSLSVILDDQGSLLSGAFSAGRCTALGDSC